MGKGKGKERVLQLFQCKIIDMNLEGEASPDPECDKLFRIVSLC